MYIIANKNTKAKGAQQVWKFEVVPFPERWGLQGACRLPLCVSTRSTCCLALNDFFNCEPVHALQQVLVVALCWSPTACRPPPLCALPCLSSWLIPPSFVKSTRPAPVSKSHFILHQFPSPPSSPSHDTKTIVPTYIVKLLWMIWCLLYLSLLYSCHLLSFIKWPGGLFGQKSYIPNDSSKPNQPWMLVQILLSTSLTN